jgi:hypothetical protein
MSAHKNHSDKVIIGRAIKSNNLPGSSQQQQHHHQLNFLSLKNETFYWIILMCVCIKQARGRAKEQEGEKSKSNSIRISFS